MKILNLSFEKSFGAVIFRREGEKIKYLLLKYHRGHWEFPRGHQEAGETPIETALREIQEETGLIDVEIIPGFFESHWFWYLARSIERERRKHSGKGISILKKVGLYLAETKTQKIELFSPDEQTGYEWLEYKYAIERITFKKPKKILQKAHRFIEDIS